MSLKLFLSDETRDRLRHFPPDIKQKVRAGLDEVSLRPRTGKELSEKLEGWRSYRAGALRIIYRYEPRGIEVLVLGNRRTIYEEAARTLREKR